MNYVSLSVMMEFSTPKAMDDVEEEQQACLDLIVEIGRASIHFVNLSMVTSKWV